MKDHEVRVGGISAAMENKVSLRMLRMVKILSSWLQDVWTKANLTSKRASICYCQGRYG